MATAKPSFSPEHVLPVCCPICGVADAERILDDITVTAHTESVNRRVTRLAVFMCHINGHIFFVRQSDLVVANSSESGI
jgi:hypothetical protein